jgi:hypothetical protein
MAQAAHAADVRPDKISFKGALQTFNAFLPQLLHARTPEERAGRWAALIAAIGQHRVGDRSGRYEPQAVKRRRKKYAKLTTTRQEARRRLRDGETSDQHKD